MLKTAEFVYWGILALGVLLIVFQIVVPALTGTPFFPMLRHKPSEALKKLAEATEDKQVRDIESEAASLSPTDVETALPPQKPTETTQQKPKGKGK